MTEVIFTFDTEDYTNPGSDEAVLRLAEILREEKVRASFNIVAALAEALVARGRQDIVEALRCHEINYHTYRHSWHPVPVEFSDTADWDGPYRRLIEQEAPGIEIVKKVFQRDRLYASVPPGNCVTAQGLFAYAEMGLPVCVSSFPMRNTGGRSIYYCDGVYIENNAFWDSLLLSEGLAGVLGRIQEWRTWHRLVICLHPNLILYETFWDKLNLDGYNQVEWGQWRLPQRRSEQVINQFFADYRQAVRVLKDDPHFEFVAFQQVVESRPVRKNLSRTDLNALLDAANQKFFFVRRSGSKPAGVNGSGSGGYGYSLAEMFWACVYFLNGGTGEYPLGTVAGPSAEPEGIRKPVLLQAVDLRAAAAWLAAAQPDGMKAIPHQVQAGPHLIGPRDFMEAARIILSGAEQVEITPCSQIPEIGGFYHLDEAHLAGTWLYSPDFKDEWVSKRLKWQAWTIYM